MILLLKIFQKWSEVQILLDVFPTAYELWQ